MEFANRLAKYEQDPLGSASQPRQGPDALGTISISNKSDVPKSIFPIHKEGSIWSSTLCLLFGTIVLSVLYCNHIHALQFFYFATGLPAGMALAFEYWHHAPDI